MQGLFGVIYPSLCRVMLGLSHQTLVGFVTCYNLLPASTCILLRT